jgi:hypothetical protein
VIPLLLLLLLLLLLSVAFASEGHQHIESQSVRGIHHIRSWL